MLPAAAQGTRCESGAVPQLSPGSRSHAMATVRKGGKAGTSVDPGARRPVCVGSCREKGRVDVVELQVRSRQEGGRPFPVLVWRSPRPPPNIAPPPHRGGGGGRRRGGDAQSPAG